MATLRDLQKKYHGLIAPLDLELLFSFVLKKPREFVLAHPEHAISRNQESIIKKYVKRRINHEPLAYILGKKEFYGLDFKVDKNTLVPRPETELMVELALEEVRKLVRKRLRTINVVDVGTGSGNIAISIAHNVKRSSSDKLNFFAIDISKKALAIARKNAKSHKLNKKIKFIHGSLLDPIIGRLDPPAGGGNSRTIVLANLPYLSSAIYASTPKDVKDYEPKSALWSPEKGLAHYAELLRQIAPMKDVSCFMEISPEQKPLLQKMAGKIFPSAKIIFHRDLAGKWRLCQVETDSL